MIHDHASLLRKLSHLLFMRAGVSETVCLNMATLVWSVVTTVQGRVPLASEVLKNALPYNFSYECSICEDGSVKKSHR